jgi:hypothetical protein
MPEDDEFTGTNIPAIIAERNKGIARIPESNQ